MRKILSFKFILVLFILIFLSFVFLFWNGDKVSIIKKEKIKNSVLIDYPKEYNYRQTASDCGPFSVSAVVRVIKKEDVKKEEFVKNMKWRLPNGYTLPWGVEKQLKENNLKIRTPNLKNLSDEDKLNFLKEQFSISEKPMIILGERSGYEHYFTILGFNSLKDEFYVYDSFIERGGNGLTVDKNGDLPGNRTYNSKDLLDFWRGSGMFGLYKWYLVVVE